MSKVWIQNTNDNNDISGMLDDLGIDGQGAVIKVNWSTPDTGFYTDAEGLDFLLSKIKGRKVILESYMYGRTDDYKRITPENGREHWEWFKSQDKKFFERTGIAEVMQRHNAEFINITEECWTGNTVDSGTIKALTEEKFSPIQSQELYGTIPTRLFELRNMPLISYAKIKYQIPKVGNYSTFSIKNLFGLIPTPNRHVYHDRGLARSILDIASIYSTLFNIVGIVDGRKNIAVYREPGKNKYKMIFTDYDLILNTGIFAASRDIVTLDAFINTMVGHNANTHEMMLEAARTLWHWDADAVNYVPEEFSAQFREYL